VRLSDEELEEAPVDESQKFIPKWHLLLFQLGFLAFFSLPPAVIMVFQSLAAGEVIHSVCYVMWVLGWAAFYRHGFENWNFKELRTRFDSAFEMDKDGYNDHADEEELRNLMVRVEDASQRGYFETVADIRVIIPKIANRGNISSKFRTELKEKFPYLDIK
jgi:hypothetical protein